MVMSKKSKKNKRAEITELDVVLGFMRQPLAKRMAYFEKSLQGVEHRVIGDFIVSELPNYLQDARETENAQSLIIHHKSGQWRCFTLCYQCAVEMLLKNPESETELLQCLFGT